MLNSKELRDALWRMVIGWWEIFVGLVSVGNLCAATKCCVFEIEIPFQKQQFIDEQVV
jgi:hypothetical protein